MKLRNLTIGSVKRLSSVRSNGIGFELNETQLAMKELAKKFAVERILPSAAKYDKSGEYPDELVKEAHGLGLMNPLIPEKAGGAGYSLLDACIMTEELSYGCSGVATAMVANSLAAAPLIVGASEAIQKEFLGRLVAEPLKASYAVTEPGAGSDVSALKTKAEKKGDKWVINGQKMWITNATVANWFFVLAKTNPNARTGEAFTGFVVPAGTPGLTVGRKENMMGQRCSSTAGVTFEDVVVPDTYRVGPEGAGFKIAMRSFDITRPPVAIQGVGIARRAMDEALQYAKTRKTFGVPIAQHGAIQTMLVDMKVGIELGRMQCYRAAWEFDQGKRNTTTASIAKIHCAELCMKASLDAVQIFGGAGYNCDFPVEKLVRDSKILSIYEGTSQIQKTIVAKDILS